VMNKIGILVTPCDMSKFEDGHCSTAITHWLFE